MHKITERNIFLREQIALPEGLKLITSSFREEWNFVRSINLVALEKQIVACGWNLINISDGIERCGVGETRQESIASALKLSLRRISSFFNAVELKHLELTQYPWFFMARVRVFPYRIQQGDVVPVSDEVIPVARRQRRLHPLSDVLYPHFGSAMPQLKQMLISSRMAQARPL